MNKAAPFAQVQRIVLHGSLWAVAQHLVLRFPVGASTPLGFLQGLRSGHLWPTPADTYKTELQLSLGFSRRGLEHALVPKHVLASFALKSPAFCAGAALRASSRLGASGSNAPACWDAAFGFMTLDAVLSLHAMDQGCLDEAAAAIRQMAEQHGVPIIDLPVARRLQQPPRGLTQAGDGGKPPQWTHFGYRDGLARVDVEGWPRTAPRDVPKPAPLHQPGEFLLGHRQNCGANPWIAGHGKRVWPEPLRTFFLDGSFGVLQQLEQHVDAFETFVGQKAKALRITPDLLKAKLCGRYPDGRPLVAPDAQPEDDFDYDHDALGHACPFGSHIRRMNPRGAGLAHAGRARPLLRRGMPYGPEWSPEAPDTEQRGLIGHFYCASIEDQYEHLLGEWAERVPLGSADRGEARDPLIGSHEPGDGHFEMPQPDGRASTMLWGLRAFTRNRGTAYLFYPGLRALDGIADERSWAAEPEDDE